MEAKFPDIERSGRFLAYFQAVGVCEALRIALQTGNKPSKSTVDFLRKLREDAQHIATGNAFERLPVTDESSSPADLLVAAEVIRASMLAFLSPEEIESSEQSFSLLNSLAQPLGNFLGSAFRRVVE
jgi:hypothetical protein